MNSLYEITNNFMQLTELAEKEEITEEEYNQIGQELALQIQAKSPNLIGYYQNEKALIESVDIQIKRLQEFKKSKQNSLERYTQYVKENLEKLGITKIETELGTISITKNPISIEIINEYEVPNEFKEEVITTKIDKTKIKDNFKATGEIPAGVKINTENTSLRVR